MHAGSENRLFPKWMLCLAKTADSSVDYHQDTNAYLVEDWFVHRCFKNIPKHNVKVIKMSIIIIVVWWKYFLTLTVQKPKLKISWYII